MKIVVLGAAGELGKDVVDQAVAAGHSVTAFVHTPEHYARTDVRVVGGDARDNAAVLEAVQGQDAVLDAIGSHLPFVNKWIERDSAGTVIEAMQEAGVRRLIVVSTIGEGDSEANVHNWYKHLVMLTLLHGVMPDKAAMEKTVEGSALDWTIVRPAGLKEGPAKGVHIVEPATGEKARFITRADVAHFMLEQLSSDQYVHKAVGIANRDED